MNKDNEKTEAVEPKLSPTAAKALASKSPAKKEAGAKATLATDVHFNDDEHEAEVFRAGTKVSDLPEWAAAQIYDGHPALSVDEPEEVDGSTVSA